MTYTHRNRGDGSRCYILPTADTANITIQVEGHPCTQTLAPVVFHRRWVAIEQATGWCTCGGQAVEQINGLALCAECAEIERGAG